MGQCTSRESEEDICDKRDLHVAGLHPGDTPHPLKLNIAGEKSRQGTPTRRSSNTSSNGQSSGPPSISKPPKLLLPTPDTTPVDENDVEIELYDTCPTPYPISTQGSNGRLFVADTTLMKIEFITAVVDNKNVKDLFNGLVLGFGPLHIRDGFSTVLGADYDKKDGVFFANYIYKSHEQLHKSCDKKGNFILRAPKGLRLRIVCVSHRGQDYVASANALLREGNTKLEIPAGKADEMLKCIPSHSSLALEAPYLFTYIYESDIRTKSCGILSEFYIPQYEPPSDKVDPAECGNVNVNPPL